ncbi:MAG: hypothetical protein LBK71_00090, partial [Verrucomicrobiales bacterium]|nr:hypothetical protein [Verrucomicrobiales bacterium]
MHPKLTFLILCALSVSALNVFAENKVFTSGTVTEADQTYTAVSGTAALQVSGSGTLYSGTNITLNGTDVGNAGRYGAYVYNQGRIEIYGGTITTSNTEDGYGIYLTGSATGLLRNVTIKTTGFYGHGVYDDKASRVVADGLDITTEGDRAYGFQANDGVITNSTITTSGSMAFGLMAQQFLDSGSGQLTADHVKVVTYGIAASGVELAGANSKPNVITVHLTDLEVTTFNESANAINTGADMGVGIGVTRILVVDGGSYTAHQGAALSIGGGGTSSQMTDSLDCDFTIKGGAVLSGTAALNISSGILSDGTPSPTVTTLRVTEQVTLLGDVNFKGSATSTVSLDGNSSLTGRVNATDTSRTELNFSASILDGDITATENSTLTVTASNGSVITGAVSGNDSATLDLTLSGTGSTLLGDITQSGSSAVTVILDHNATGSGGYHGGNLITGEDSTWTFNKNSHGHYGENNGVWNIGDYDVIFDNMTHTGTVTISVNSDTGEGGSITVTGTADGAGTVHIDTTGNGKADPNQVLPGKVTGDGTEHWQWDPINWGIDTIIKDGDHFIKQGTSPAGAVLNSSVAIQQAMWFAQQNSLLKRMGDLRYGARASRPLAGETPALHIIENIWIRSYGQQLNVGSQVSGKAYEQLIYGVDLGTDHKFTISADSDLYLGVYAGYGRSD